METEWMNETSAEVPSAPAAEKPQKKKFSLKGFGGKKKRWLKVLIILAVVAAIVVGCVARMAGNVNTQLAGSYLVAAVTRQDLTVSVSGTATLQPADSYNVTTLLSGDIIDAPFEEGDLVSKDTCSTPWTAAMPRIPWTGPRSLCSRPRCPMSRPRRPCTPPRRSPAQ